MNNKRTVLLLCFFVGLLGFSAYWFTTDHARAQSEATLLPIWEYAELYVTEIPSKKQTQILFLPPNKMPRNSSIFNTGKLNPNDTYFSALDVVGNLGWEIYQVRYGYAKTEPYRTIYYLKRRKN